MKFTGDYISEGMAEVIAQFEKDYESAEIAMDLDGDTFGNPDILDLMDFLGDTGDKSKIDKMVRQCVIGKNVSFKLDGDPIGAIRLNGIADSWASFPVFTEYPMAYKTLADIVTVHLLKKSKLPRKKGTGPGAVAAVC